MYQICITYTICIKYVLHILYVSNYANLILSPLSPILPFYFRSSTGQTDKEKKTKTPDPIEEQEVKRKRI